MTPSGISDGARAHTAKVEREHITSQLYHGRLPNEMHDAIDRAASEYIRQLRGSATRARLYEAQCEILRRDLQTAIDHLRQIGTYGDAHKLVARLEGTMLETAR